MDNEQDLKKVWGRRIKRARDVHKKMMVEWFDKIIKEYSGDWQYDTDTNEKYDQVAQVIHAVEETIQPHLLFQSPNFLARARRPEFDKAVKLVEAVINHEYRDTLPTGRKIELENEQALIDARLLPYGGTKTSYVVEGTIIEEPQETGMLDKVKNFFTGNKPEPTQTPVITKELGHVTRRFDPLKVMIDPDAKHITEGKYVIEEIDARKEDLSSPRYDQAKVSKLEPDVCLDSDRKVDVDKKSFDNYLKENPDSSGYRLYEIHDLENRVIHTYSEQLKDFLEEGSQYPIDEGSQYNFLWFVEIPNKAYPVPPIKFYRRRAIEFSYIYTQVQRQIDKFLPKLGIDGTKLSPADKERLKNGNVATIFETIGPPGNAVQQFNFSIQKELFEYLAIIKELLNMESGVNDYEMAAPDQDRLATEAKMIQKGTSVRRFKPRKRVKDFLLAQASTILKIIQKNQSQPKFVQVLGENDAAEWWSDPVSGKPGWTKEAIQGDYMWDFDVETMIPFDSSIRKIENEKSMETVLNPMLRQSLMAEGKQLIISPIFEKYAKENLGINDKSKLMVDLNIREPEKEHDIWMQGQFPAVQQNENVENHYNRHSAWIQSPAFQFLPEELKAGAIGHIQQTEQALAIKQQTEQNNRNQTDVVPS